MGGAQAAAAAQEGWAEAQARLAALQARRGAAGDAATAAVTPSAAQLAEIENLEAEIEEATAAAAARRMAFDLRGVAGSVDGRARVAWRAGYACLLTIKLGLP